MVGDARQYSFLLLTSQSLLLDLLVAPFRDEIFALLLIRSILLNEADLETRHSTGDDADASTHLSGTNNSYLFHDEWGLFTLERFDLQL